MILGAAVVCAALGQAPAAPTGGGTGGPPALVLRRGEPPPGAPVSHLAPGGVVLAAEGERGVVLGWDRVRAAAGEGAEAFLALGEKAWRARQRLERGDAPLAEPLFEELFEYFQWRTGPTPALVAEGLLRCRLRRGAHLAAIDPWLALRFAAGESGGPVHLHADWAEQAGLGAVVDPVTGLAQGLPPMWVASPVVQAFAARPPGQIAGEPSGAADSVRALAALYRHAARFEAGWADPWPEPRAPGAAVTIVSDIVLARTGDEGERAAARSRLADRLSAGPDGWLQAWLHAAIGRSLARESGRDERLMAVVELLHAPAAYAPAQPYLAGLCLAEAAVLLDDLGDPAGASRLAADLVQAYPGHAALDWEPFRTRWGRTPPAPTPPAPAPPAAPTSKEPTT